jgi:hypothetical protein
MYCARAGALIARAIPAAMTSLVRHVVKGEFLRMVRLAPGVLCEQYRVQCGVESSAYPANQRGGDPNDFTVTIARPEWILALRVFVEGAFFSEQMVIMLSEAMGLVANVLEQPQGE